MVEAIQTLALCAALSVTIWLMLQLLLKPGPTEMSPTRRALEASIEKWERNARAERPEYYTTSADACALCHLFVIRNVSCDGCPVKRRTGVGSCIDTPYIKASETKIEWITALAKRASSKTIDDLREEAHEAARLEVEFLKSLRRDTL